MKIVVDTRESPSRLADFLAQSWNSVTVRQLSVGDVAIGNRILIERKTSEDFLASLEDGRLFRQARRLTDESARPIVIHEGTTDQLFERMDSGAYRGVILALAVGFRIPVLRTVDTQMTAEVVRHIAAQESRRSLRRRARSDGMAAPQSVSNYPFRRASPETFDALLALPRVGPSRAAALAARVNSLAELASLSVRDLIGIPGIGIDTAVEIFESVHGIRRSG